LKVDMLGELGPYVVDAYGRKLGDVGEEVGLKSLSCSSRVRRVFHDKEPKPVEFTARVASYLPMHVSLNEPLRPFKDVLGCADEELCACLKKYLMFSSSTTTCLAVVSRYCLCFPIRNREHSM